MTTTLMALLASCQLSMTPPVHQAPAPCEAVVQNLTTAAAQEAATVARPATPPEDLRAEVTVTEWTNQRLLRPRYDAAARPSVPFIGIIRGGASGSPGFDPVLHRYWWE